MTAPYFSLNVGGSTLYAKMPGGSVKLPLGQSERDKLVAALKEALEILQDDISQRGDATESG